MRLYCFEDEADAARHAAWYPELAEQIFDFPSLVRLLCGTSPPENENRSLALQNLLPGRPPESYGPLLATIELLRAAMLLSPEDFRYAFEELPQTPKNRALLADCLTYLDSPLASDLAARVAQTRESLRSGDRQGDREVRFYSSIEHSYLFTEVAKAFPQEDNAVLNLSDWENGKKTRKRFYYQAEPQDALFRLALALANRRRRKNCAIGFHGSRAELAFLKLMLEAQGVPYQDETGIAAARGAPDPLTLFRQDRSLPLLERLRKGHELLTSHETAQGVMFPEERALENEPNAVTLLPLRPYRLPGGAHYFIYAGRSVLEERNHLLLSIEELESLKLKGVALVAPSDRIQSRLSVLRWASESRRDHVSVFSPLSEEHWEKARAVRLKMDRARPPVIDDSALPPIELPRGRFSSTGLTNLAECPRKFLFAQRLRLRPLVQSPEDSYAWMFGQLVHRVLEQVFQTTPPPLADSAKLNELFEKAVEELFPKVKLDTAFRALLSENFARTIRSLPRLESALVAIRGKGRPIAFEVPFRFGIDGGKENLQGVIDRIDETESGEVLVVDYKTGAVDFSPVHIEKGSNFQALLYLIAAEKLYQKPCVGVVFYDLKQGEVRRGFLRAEKISTEARKAMTRGHALDAEKFSSIESRGIEIVRSLMTKVEQGEFPATPSAQACQYCDFTRMCRRAHGYR